jgi:hypothetical protein
MTEILSGARKYHFGLILAHQELRQLWSRDSELASSVISNPGTRICFRLGDFDAKKLEDGFSSFDAQDLQNLGVGEAIARIERADYDFNLKTLPLPEIARELARKRREKLVDLSRQKYALPKEQLASILAKQKELVLTEEPIAETSRTSLEEIREIKEDTKQEVLSEEKPLYYRRKRAEAEETALEGVGGDKHRGIQDDIKKVAQDNGFLVLIEHPTPDGRGKVDVHLECDGLKIACEVCVTCPDTHELSNIEKCLNAGYDKVILCSPEKKVLKKDEWQRVLFFLPDELTAYLKEEAVKAASITQKIRGYEVKSHLKPVSEEKQEAKRRSILGTLWPFRRPKNDK